MLLATRPKQGIVTTLGGVEPVPARLDVPQRPLLGFAGRG